MTLEAEMSKKIVKFYIDSLLQALLYRLYKH